MSELATNSTFDVLETPISAVNINKVASLIQMWSKDTKGRFVCIRDVASLMAIRAQQELKSLHRQASLVTPDGMPIVLIGRIKGYDVERVCGPDLMEYMLKHSNETGLTHYLYGGKEGVAEKIVSTFKERFGVTSIVGHEAPPFRELTESETKQTLARIKESGADVVWVGLSSPKQDIWMWKNFQQLPQTLVGVGAAFDFHSGAVKRAPKWMQAACLEWLYRLKQEPARLYKRYLFLAPLFLASLLFEKFRK